MFAVHETSDNRFKITYPTKRGKSREEIIVDTPEEVHEALNHHFRCGPRAAQHERNGIDHCPLCRSGRKATVPLLKLVSVVD